jgi:hypothetical protein
MATDKHTKFIYLTTCKECYSGLVIEGPLFICSHWWLSKKALKFARCFACLDAKTLTDCQLIHRPILPSRTYWKQFLYHMELCDRKFSITQEIERERERELRVFVKLHKMCRQQQFKRQSACSKVKDFFSFPLSQLQLVFCNTHVFFFFFWVSWVKSYEERREAVLYKENNRNL